MPVKPLPPNPNLDHLKHQAKNLLKAHTARTPDVAQRLREFHPRFTTSTDAEIFAAHLKLADAQLTIARERGFASWARLKRRVEKPTLADRLDLPHHERIEDPPFRRAVDLLDAGDVEGLRVHLKQHPNPAHQHVLLEGSNYFTSPALLEFVAENPTRRGSLPANIVEVARVILDAGATQEVLDRTLELVASSAVAQHFKVQAPLIELLCGYGANPNRASRVAAIYAQLDAIDALLRGGARFTLPIATILGRLEDARRLVADADNDDRRWAMAIAAQYGNVEIIRLLLDAGVDPNHYNPLGGHSHSTPLHQAAGYGHLEVAQLLVERGAKLDWKDTMWHATPVEWAQHEGKAEVERYLREQENGTKRSSRA